MSENQLMTFLKKAVISLNKYVSHPQFKQLIEIASINFDIADIYTSEHAEKINTPILFLAMSSHSSCLAAYVMALIGHPSATTSVSRTALEAALYAYGISRDPVLLEKWKNPPRNRRGLINASGCINLLKNSHPQLVCEVDNLYRDLISMGAHPNRSSLFRTSNVDKHLFEDDHVYSDAPLFAVDVIMEPGSKSIVQLTIAITVHAYALHICALADEKHPKASEIITKSKHVQQQLMNFLKANQENPGFDD